MPHTIQIRGESAVAEVTVDGSIDVTYWRWLLYDAVQQSRSASLSSILLDLTAADLHIEPERLLEVGETVSRQLTPDIRLAAVLPAASDRSRLVETEDAPVHFFESEAVARKWLSGPSREAAA